MQKLFIFLLGLFLIVGNAFDLQARVDHQPQAFLSIWPVDQKDIINHLQVSVQDHNFHISQNYSFVPSNSSQDRYQQHRQFILKNFVVVPLLGKFIKIMPEDIYLINRICADNSHKNQDELRMQLAQSSAFNYTQHFFNGDQELQAFASDIYINKAYFSDVSESEKRIAKLEAAAKDAVEAWYKQDKAKLSSNSKTKSQDTKNLKAKYQRRKQYFLGNKQDVQILINNAKKSLACNPVASTVKKSNISSQEIQKLREYNNNQAFKAHSNKYSSSYKQVINQRSQALDLSVKNQALTTEHIKIDSQTLGFLQAQGIDIAQFQQIEGLSIQHQLTHELVDVLDAVAEYAQQHHYEIYQTHLTKYCAHLAFLSQQSNVAGALQQAIDGTNCCYGIAHCLKGMVSGVTQAYQQFQTALDYFDTVVDTYGNLLVRHGVQGAAIAHGLEAIVTAGMIAAPTATAAATGMMIGATAYVIAPVCLQAMIDTIHFGGACITGNWDKVVSDLDNFGKFISSKETVARMAEFAGSAAMPTSNLNFVVYQVLSLRPVITSVQNASGEMVQSLYLMTKNQLQKVYTQGLELLQLSEFINFNMSYKNILGFNFFDILPKSHPALVVAMEEIETGLFNSAEQVSLANLFTQSEQFLVDNIVKSRISNIADIDKITGSLRKRVSDLVRRGIGLENLSYDEMDLIAKTVKKERNIDIYRSGDLSKVNVKFTDNGKHMFREDEGHRPDSPEFRAEIMMTVKNIKNYHGSDVNNNDWYSEMLPDGTQRWVSVCQGIIKNCGINNIPKTYNPITGLSRLTWVKK